MKAEYDALEPEFNIIQAMIDARKHQNLTQEELSKELELRRLILVE